MTYTELYNLALSPAKRKAEKGDIWVSLFARPLSVLCTLPLVKTSISPTTITKWSIVCAIIGFIMISFFPCSMTIKIMGWFMFFAWAILDGVDGNLARAVNKCSKIGELWDAIGGYSAMILTYQAAGILAYYENNYIYLFDNYIYLIIGGFTSLASIFPRLILQKKSNIFKTNTSQTYDKKKGGIIQKIAQNLLGVSSIFQVIFLIVIIFHLVNLFVVIYFIINIMMMLIMLRRIVKLN